MWTTRLWNNNMFTGYKKKSCFKFWAVPPLDEVESSQETRKALEVQAKGPNKSQRRERGARVTKDLNMSRVW